MDYLDNLNEEQRAAAMHIEGPLLILAGAGSGKTSTMTKRIAYMIKEKGISPYEILAVTFTNKAAREMRERVEQIIGESTRIWIQTFHSACLRILRMNAEKIGYTSDFTIYDPTDLKAVVKAATKEVFGGKEPANKELFKPTVVLGIISDAKEHGIDSRHYAERAEDYRENIIAKIYMKYEATLKKNNAMDFDDLIWKTVLLLERNPDVLENLRSRFRYIMVDEYQDTNMLQYKFVKLLAEEHRNICVVGDDDQCIYQWRGADVRYILSFENDFPEARVIKLEKNYRSTANILNAANSVIKHNIGRKDKKLKTDAEPGCKLMYRRLDTEKEEARYTAQEIRKGIAEGRKYSDFAVLYRTNAQSRAFEAVFAGLEIPYVVLGGLKFYDRKEIKDMMAYMRLVVNPNDDLAMQRIINEPKRSVGAKTLEKLMTLASVREESLFEVLTDEDVLGSLPKKTSAALEKLIGLLLRCHAEHEEMKISDLYDLLLSETGYLESLEKAGDIESQGRIENLLEFKSAIYDEEENNPYISLSEFMESLTLAADIDKHDPDVDSVVLMTLHSAKGLEFPVVFMPGMEDGLFPGWRSLDTREGVEEERRLCYVGITRAREKLYLTGAVARTLYGRTDYTRESQFLKELDKSLLDDSSDRPGKRSYQERQNTNDAAEAPLSRYGMLNKPFDNIGRIHSNSEEMKKNAALRKGEFAAGDKVSHPKFGEGVVLSVKGEVCRIAFDSVGIKSISLGFVQMKKI